MNYLFQSIISAPYVSMFEIDEDVWSLSGFGLPSLTFSPSLIVMAPAGDCLAVGDSSRIWFYAFSGGAAQRINTSPLSAGNGEQNASAWSPSGHRFALSDGQNVKIWRRTGDIIEEEFSIPAGAATYSYSFISDDLILVARDSSPQLLMYRLSADNVYQLIWSSPQSGFQRLVCASGDGQYLAIPTSSGSLVILKRAGDGFEFLASISGGTYAPVGCVFSGDGLSVVVSGQGGWLYFYQRNGDDFRLVSSGVFNTSYAGGTMVFNRDDSRLYIPQTSASQAKVNVFARVLNHYEQIGVITTPANVYFGMAMSPPRGFSAGFKPISGHVFDADGNPVSRIVRAYHRDTGNLVGEAVSDPLTGEYGFNAFKWVPHYVVVLDDGAKNAMILDHITPIDLP